VNNHRERLRRVERQAESVEAYGFEWAVQTVIRDLLSWMWWECHRYGEVPDPAALHALGVDELPAEDPGRPGVYDQHRAARILWPDERVPGCDDTCPCRDPGSGPGNFGGGTYSAAQVDAWRLRDEKKSR